MNSISFKNFRKFEEFPEFKFGDITILVGSNNAGKSTLAKAINFLVYNLNNIGFYSRTDDVTLYSLLSNQLEMPSFRMDILGNYRRVHSNVNESPMEFCVSLGKCLQEVADQYKEKERPERFHLSFTLENAQENDRFVKIEKIELRDNELGLHFFVKKDEVFLKWVDFNDKSVHITDDSQYENLPSNESERYNYFKEKHETSFHNIDSYIRNLRKEFDIYYRAFDEEVDEADVHIQYALMYNCWIRYIRMTDNAFDTDSQGINYNGIVNYKFPLFEVSGTESTSFLTKFLEGIFLSISDRDECKSTFETYSSGDYQFLLDRIKDSLLALDKLISRLSSVELPIHSLERSVVFTKNHQLWPLIKEFDNITEKHVWALSKDSMLSQKPYSYSDFFVKMLNLFCIAEDYRINEIGGDVYTFEVKQNGKWVDIADIGTGAMKIIEIVLFIINAKFGSMVFLEEPEQNLHPKLQSKLSEFFLNVYKELGIKIIVETHSEYLVRRSQVEVYSMNLSKEELETKNPFKVYYFPNDGHPYDMKYLEDGRFSEEFGSGFFDEASNLLIRLFGDEDLFR